MSSSPVVTVVIPVYNGEKYLRETLESILKQDYGSFETIAVDDGSSDSSAAIIQSFPAVRYVPQKNQGNAVARNKGIELARGTLIATLDQDDLWLPNKLRAHVKYLDEHPEVDYTTAKHRMFLAEGVAKPAWCKEEWLARDLVDYSPGSLVFRRTAFNKVGLFDTSLVSGHDTDWLLRAKDAGLKEGVLSETLLLKRVHADNQSGEVKRVHSEMLSVFRRSIQRKKNEGP